MTIEKKSKDIPLEFCNFCGREGKAELKTHWERAIPSLWVACECGGQGPSVATVYVAGRTQAQMSEIAAIEAVRLWNTRHVKPLPVETEAWDPHPVCGCDH